MKLYVINGNDNYLLSLRNSTKINLSIYNPMFSNVGLFSQLITVFRTDNNRFFKYTSSLQSLEIVSLSFKLVFGADAIIEGDVKVTDSDDNRIEFYLKSGNSSTISYLKSTLMSEASFWGSYQTPSFYEETLEGNYPQYPVVLPPMLSSEGSVWLNNNFVTIYPAIYLRHIINTLISGLGYAKLTDSLAAIPDFNRVALFAPKDTVADWQNTGFNLKDYMPDVSISDFLDDVLQRFNTFIYFSPTTREAEVLNLSDILNITPDDWTKKVINLIKLAPSTEKQIVFSNSAKSSSDLLTVAQINDVYLETVANIVDLPSSSPTHIKYYVTAEDRYYQSIPYTSSSQMVPGGIHTEAYELSGETETIDSGTYYSVKPLPGVTLATEKTNTSDTANAENIITQFALEPTNGNIEENIEVKIYASVNTGTSSLIAKAVLLNADTGGETSLGEHKVDVSQTAATFFRLLFRAGSTNEFNDTNRLVIRLYSLSTNTNRFITLRFGGNYNGDYLFTTLETDTPYNYWQEYGRLNTVTYGTPSSGDAPTVITPKSIIPLNKYAAVNNIIAEITQTTLSKKGLGEQTNFEWLVYRGKKESLQVPGVYVAHCNYDNRDLELKDYSSEMENGITPSLVLKWNKDKGLLSELFKNRLAWERYLKRKVSMNMQLSYNDIFNRPIYKPFSVQGSNIIAEKITLTIDVFDNITDQRVEGYTI